MTLTSPNVSYIISNYNSAHFLKGLLHDLLEGQSHKNIEVVLVDSASTDSSLEVAKRMSHDERLVVIEQDERTPYGVSWLEGWKAARGEVVGNSNTDDRSYPWRTVQVMIASIRPPDLPLGSRYDRFYYGGYETWQNNICIAKGLPPKYSEEDLAQFFRCGVHVHWDNAIRDIADWGRMMQAGYEYGSAFDYWLVLYFISLGVKGSAIQSCFSIYNQREDSVEQSDKERNTFESLRAIEEFYPQGKTITDLETKTRQDNPGFYERYREFCRSFGD